MASKQDIREAFYSELESAVPSAGNDGHVPPDDITQENPDSEEDIPAIAHSDASRKVPINQASDAPTRVERDSNDNAVAENYGSLHELQFGLLFWFTSDVDKEACYEAVRTHFERYEESPSTWDPADIHSDVKWVRVLDATSEDDPSSNPTRRGDRLGIRLTFLREARYPDDGSDGDSIQQVDHETDADNDGTTDATWSTT